MSELRIVLFGILSLAFFMLGLATLLLGLSVGYRMGRREDLLPSRAGRDAPCEFDAIDERERQMNATLASANTGVETDAFSDDGDDLT